MILVRRGFNFLLFALVAAALWLVLAHPDWIVAGPPTVQAWSVEETECPAGSYEIGRSDKDMPICKKEPTGCPYGDSIPLGPDCDKHAPAPVVYNEANQTDETDPVPSFGK